jgi:hypothetical protein
VFDVVLLTVLHALPRLTCQGVNNRLETLLGQCYLRFTLIQILQNLILSTAGIVFTELTDERHGITVI